MERRTDRLLTAAEKTLIKEYRNALKRIRAELAQLYTAFPMTGAQRIEQRRLRNLEMLIVQLIQQLYQNAQKTLYDSLVEVYRHAYHMTGWAIEMELGGAQLAWGVINPDVIRRAVLAPIDRLTLNDRLERNRRKVVAEIKHQLTQGLILGNSYEEMAQRMKKMLEGDARKARVIARTEGHRIRNTGKMDSAKRASELGLEMVKVWDATLDLRTRPAHRKLDGKKVGVDENFISPSGGIGPAPGMMKNPSDDINCRCTFRLEFPGFEPSVRRVRGEGIVPYQTYEQWAKVRGIKI
jgi:SPP1 gp7 family putative phage head morphogenesis protein